jgi:Protein of unknown function (DUF998)
MVIGGLILYVLLDIVAQILPPYYNPIRTAESDLAVGPYGYIMTLNFLNRGILSLLFLYALTKTIHSPGGFETSNARRQFKIGTIIFGVWGVGAILLAIFPTDVPATPISWHGAIHGVLALPVFIGGAIGAVILSLQFGKSRILRSAKPASLSIAVLSAVLLIIVVPTLTTSIGGLTERLFLGSVLLWVGFVSVYLIRQDARKGGTH